MRVINRNNPKTVLCLVMKRTGENMGGSTLLLRGFRGFYFSTAAPLRLYAGIVLFLVLALASYAQEGTNAVQVITKEYDTKVKDADKISLTPSIPEVEEKISKLSYKVPARDFKDIPFVPNPLRPLGMSADKLERFNSSYIKLGIGTQLTPLVELMYNDTRNKNLRYGFNYDHLSQYGFKIDNQKYSDDRLGAYLRYYPGKVELATSFAFHNLRTHFYGIGDTAKYDGANIRQNLRDYDLNISLKNAQKTSIGLDYGANIRGNYFQETYGGGSEYFINPKVNTSYGFKKYHNAYAALDADFSNYTSATQNLNRSLVKIGVGYGFNNDDWKARLGFTLAVDGSDVNALPDLMIEKRLYQHQFIAYLGWEMRLQKNSFKSLSERNNYLESNIQLRNTRVSDLYGGVKGTISSFGYNLGVAYKNINFMPLFYIDQFDTKRFLIGYDTRVDAFNTLLELGYNYKDDLRLLLSADINSYSAKDNKEVWNEPLLKISIKGSYILKRKIVLGADLFAFSSYTGVTTGTSATRTTSGAVDLNLSLEYLFNKKLSFFLNLNNIAHQRYERWAYYPVYGFNGIIGGKFSF